MKRCWLAAIIALGTLAGCGETPAPVQPPETCPAMATGTMVWVPGGQFMMGEDPAYREEGPPRTVMVDGFWMDAHEVTNAQFAGFVAETGYVTLAERTPPVIQGTPPDMLQPGSAVFQVPSQSGDAWWRWVVGANWRRPSGLQDAITGNESHPVVQIAYADAATYALWAGKQLPDEAQWEYAARGGAAALPEPVDADGRPQANYYQGVFPVSNLGLDGFIGRAPVGCFAPNGFGLFDMIGNVWEWTNTSATRSDAADTVGVIKGGSYLCAANYCARYRPAARQFQERGLGTDHIGFRLIDTKRPPPSGD